MGMPSKKQIARYWGFDAAADLEMWPSLVIDWGEASCQACSYYPQAHTRYDGDPASWEKAAFLERAHIVPKSLGGDDDVSNFLLLCKRCHEDAPDTSERAAMLAWADRRGHHGWLGVKQSFEDAAAAGVTPEAMRAVLSSLDVSTHFGGKGSRLSAGTIEVVLDKAARSPQDR